MATDIALTRSVAKVPAVPFERVFMAWVLVAAVLYPRVISVWLGREWMVFAAILGLTLLVLFTDVSPRLAQSVAAISCCLIATRLLVQVLQGPLPSGEVRTNIYELVVLIPLGLAAGAMVAARPYLWPTYRRAYLTLTLLAAALAVWEHFTQTRLLPIDPTADYVDYERAVVGQDHPITMGLLFACALPLLAGSSRWAQLWAGGLLFAGIWATGSSGPMLAGAAVVPVVLWPRVRRFVTSHRALIALVAVASAGLAWYYLANVWTTTIVDSNVDEYSAGYRAALYSLLPEWIERAPLGFGTQGLPENTYYIFSYYRGVRDVSISIDSEPMYLAAQFGLFGLFGYAALFFAAIRWLRSATTPALMLLVLMVSGLLVALHAWLSIAVFWAFLVGICWKLARSTRAAATVSA